MNKRLNDFCNLVNADSVPYFSFDLLEKTGLVKAGFSSRLGGVSNGCFESMNLSYERGDDRNAVFQNFRRISESIGIDYENIVCTNQWHTVNIRKISDTSLCGQGVIGDRPSEEIDGQITDIPGVVLLAYGADCPTVYLVDKVRKAIGLVHSGWKGTLNGIAPKAIAMMNQEYGSDPGDIAAVIGPSICADCYEVGADVADSFAEKYGDNGVILPGHRPGKYQLSLWAAIKTDLMQAGVKSNNISVSGICTMCNPDLLFSHRRDGNARGSMAGFLMLKN